MDFSAQWFAWLQWPAMVASILAAWLVASTHAGRRKTGFWVFLASNVLWIGWGLHGEAPALIALQVVLGLMNVRGVRKNERVEQQSGAG